jgi:hypothetical protein
LESLSRFFSEFCFWDSREAVAFADASTLPEAPGVCAAWLALAFTPACPGVIDAPPEAEPLAEVCATAPRVSKLAIAAPIQYLLITLFIAP